MVNGDGMRMSLLDNPQTFHREREMDGPGL